MATEETAIKQKAFTFKSLFAGILGIILIAGGSKIAPTLARQELVAHQLGIGIYFYLFLICLLWNPFASRCCKQLYFNVKELVVVMAMTLTAGGFAWYGWMRQLYSQMVMVPQTALTDPRWGTYRIMEFLNLQTFPNKGISDETVIGAFIDGQNQWIGLHKIPFAGWSNIFYWGGLLITISLMCLALLLIVNKQWIFNEKLSYPLATISESMFRKEQDTHHFASLFRSPLFWIAFAFVFFMHGYNFLTSAYPSSGFNPIPFKYQLSGLQLSFPMIAKVGAWGLTSVSISFIIIGIAYFLAPALSLSVGLNCLIYLIFMTQVYEITGSAPTAAMQEASRAGAYFAFAVLLVILGRRYYGPIMLKAFTFQKTKDEQDAAAVFGARVFIVTALGTVYLFTLMGLSPIAAILMTLTLIIVYLVFTRIICETGIPIMASPFLPNTLFQKMFGSFSVGPKDLMVSGSMSGVLFGDMKQLVMPYMATGMKLSTDVGIRLKRISYLLALSIVLAFCVAFVVHLWQYYSLGVSDLPTKNSVWNTGFSDSVSAVGGLQINEQLTDAENASFFTKLKQIQPTGSTYVFFLIGMIAVFLTGFLRTRFLWWPFHAVIFCIWNTAPANAIWGSFLLGWFIRFCIVKFGGEQNYSRLKPIFLGLIFSEICAAGVIVLFGVISYWITDRASSIVYQIQF